MGEQAESMKRLGELWIKPGLQGGYQRDKQSPWVGGKSGWQAESTGGFGEMRELSTP